MPGHPKGTRGILPACRQGWRGDPLGAQLRNSYEELRQALTTLATQSLTGQSVIIEVGRTRVRRPHSTNEN